MPGSMSKEDAPSRSASLTFTIDNILNLKRRDGGDPDGSKEQRKDFQARCDELWDVRRRRDSGSDETGNWEYNQNTEKTRDKESSKKRQNKSERAAQRYNDAQKQ